MKSVEQIREVKNDGQQMKEVITAFGELKVGNQCEFMKKKTNSQGKSFTLVLFNNKQQWIPSDNIKDA